MCASSSVHISLSTMTQTKLLNLSLRVMYVSGQSPFKYDLFAKINAWTAMFCCSILAVLVLIKMCHEYNDVDVLILTLETMMSMSQVKLDSC